MKKILVGTENKAKLEGLSKVIQSVWTDAEITGVSVSSNVSDQPLSEKEGTRGALNRIRNLKAYHKADFYIGIEGYVDTTDNGMFLGGVVVIEDHQKNTGIGYSARMQMPKWMETELNNGKELGPLVQKIMNDPHNTIRHSTGTGGLLTQNLYTRVDEFTHATQCALAPFISQTIYQKR